jgi:hypothetical protein
MQLCVSACVVQFVGMSGFRGSHGPCLVEPCSVCACADCVVSSSRMCDSDSSHDNDAQLPNMRQQVSSAWWPVADPASRASAALSQCSRQHSFSHDPGRAKGSVATKF